MPSANLPNPEKTTIQLNGEPYAIEGDARLIVLIEKLKMKPGRIAVEHNRQIVAKAEYDKLMLKEGDELELINFVGGG